MSRNITLLLVAVLCLASCQDRGMYEPHKSLGAVHFLVGSGGSESKAAYSGEGAAKLERIDWQSGDALGVYCAAAKDDKYARYVVKSVGTPVGGVSSGVVEADGKELVWGDGPHVFYSYFPEKSEGGIGKGITETETKAETKIEVSASLIDKQKVIGAIDKSSTPWVAAPDLMNMLMVSKSGTYTPEGGPFDGEVSLNFTPLTTAVQFTITNQTKKAMTVKSVSLTSAASALCGDFTVDVQSTWQTPDPIVIGNETITYSHTYPVCDYTGSVTDATRTVTIEFTEDVTLAYKADPDESGKLTFTFFLQPCQDFDDLTFRITKSDNSWMQTRLGYTDGSGILFPRFMKSKVDGIFVPEGAQWTVKYGTLESGTLAVAKWNEGIDEELTLEPKDNKDLLPGKFSVSSYEYVQFAKGNLQYQAGNGTSSSPVWRFAEHQYDCIGNAKGNNTSNVPTRSTQADWIDLFGWGATGQNSFGQQPYSISTTDTDYKTVATASGAETLTRANGGDWGVCMGADWLTLSKSQMEWILGYSTSTPGTDCRTSSTINGMENARYLRCKVNNINGLIIFPDVFIWPTGDDAPKVPNTKYINSSNTAWDSVPKYTLTQFEKLEAAGVVFLPAAAGYRDGATVKNAGIASYYWLSTASSDVYAYFLRINDSSTNPAYGDGSFRHYGRSVRLVQKFENPEAKLKFINLGLPSGTLWADRNIGAKSVKDDPICCGDYYAWSKTETYYEQESSNPPVDVEWKDAYPKGYDQDYGFPYTKYDSTDGLRSLELSDDVANVVLGGGARIPSVAQWNELLENCTWTKTNNSGYGYVTLTSKINGESIILPAGGFYYGKDNTNYGNFGVYYMTSEVSSTDLSKVYTVWCGATENLECRLNSRFSGFPVRAVK